MYCSPALARLSEETKSLLILDWFFRFHRYFDKTLGIVVWLICILQQKKNKITVDARSIGYLFSRLDQNLDQTPRTVVLLPDQFAIFLSNHEFLKILGHKIIPWHKVILMYKISSLRG